MTAMQTAKAAFSDAASPIIILAKPKDKEVRRADDGVTTGKPVDVHGVDHPPHYNKHPSGIEVIEIVRYMGFNLGNAFKYVARHMEKGDPVKDLNKAAWYLADYIQHQRDKARTVSYSDECGKVSDKFIAGEPDEGIRTLLGEIVEMHRHGSAYSLTSAGLVYSLLAARVKFLRAICQPQVTHVPQPEY